jgi:hypothetical protein
MSITEMFMGLVSGRNADPLSFWRDDLKTPPEGQKESVQIAPYSGLTSRSGPRIVSPQASADIGRFRFGNQGGGFGAEHTHSNLG